MRKLRTCTSSRLFTGTPKCLPDMNKIKGAIVCKKGYKLPADLTADELEKLAHADRGERIYGLYSFVEYAKDGGEVQTSTTGYGPEEVTGLSARKDTFTFGKFNPVAHASITESPNQPFDVYYFDEDGKLFGQKDGTDTLAGIPMSGLYSNATEFNTSSNKPEQTVTFCHEDAKKAAVNYDFVILDFDPMKLILGLIPVELKPTTEKGSEYKLFEHVGGYDLTAEYGPLLAEAGEAAIDGATAVQYNEKDQTLTITSDGEVSLKAPSVLYDKQIKGIEQI